LEGQVVNKVQQAEASQESRSSVFPLPALGDWPPEELDRIWKVFRKLTALRIENSDDAEDIVQDAFVTMTEKCGEIELRKGLLVWGMGILRKKVGNYYRKTRRYSSLDRDVFTRDIIERAQIKPTAESTIHQAELRQLVDSILQNFPLPERMVLLLMFDGFSTIEIANLLYPERYQNIVNRLHRGRKRLYKELRKHGYVRSHTGARKPRYR
jgi:RNA polymerase sigma factor (sigma-70 family)